MAAEDDLFTKICAKGNRYNVQESENDGSGGSEYGGVPNTEVVSACKTLKTLKTKLLAAQKKAAAVQQSLDACNAKASGTGIAGQIRKSLDTPAIQTDTTNTKSDYHSGVVK